MTKIWFSVIGGPTHHWLARFPSVVWLALAATTLALIGTRLFGRAVGSVAGATLATNFLLLHWEQFARDLTISLFFATFATYAFVRMLEAPTSVRWAWIWAISILATAWVELFGVCVLAGHAAAYLLVVRTRSTRPRQRLEVMLGAAAFALTIPNIVLVATANNGQLSWIPPLTVRRLFDQPWIWAGRDPFALLGLGVGLVLVAVLVVPRLRRSKSWLLRDPGLSVEPWKAALLAGWLVAPFLVTIALSAIQPAYESQYLFSAAPALALFVGLAIVDTPLTIGVPLAIAMVISAGLLTANYVALPPYAGFTFAP